MTMHARRVGGARTGPRRDTEQTDVILVFERLVGSFRQRLLHHLVFVALIAHLLLVLLAGVNLKRSIRRRLAPTPPRGHRPYAVLHAEGVFCAYMALGSGEIDAPSARAGSMGMMMLSRSRMAWRHRHRSEATTTPRFAIREARAPASAVLRVRRPRRALALSMIMPTPRRRGRESLPALVEPDLCARYRAR